MTSRAPPRHTAGWHHQTPHGVARWRSRVPHPRYLVVTSGDPCGIGPEVILRALPVSRAPQRIIIIGDLAVFERTARTLHRRLPRWTVISAQDPLSPRHEKLIFIDLAHRRRFIPGKSSEQAGAASRAYLDAALQLWRQGWVDALVTAPVTKWAIERSCPIFVGQTEYLAKAMGSRHVVMMFVSPKLRIALLTRHVALREVSVRVTRSLVRHTAWLTAQGLHQLFGIRHPRLAVCGLNPHAGEAGLFGSEERRVLLPVLRACQHDGIRLEGPFAADGLFATVCGRGHSGVQYDAILCWYHDQGLIPFKLVARDEGCQLSLGLPIVRTSPDHGSALDIAGHGCADPGSMRYALTVAATLARRLHAHPIRAT